MSFIKRRCAIVGDVETDPAAAAKFQAVEWVMAESLMALRAR